MPVAGSAAEEEGDWSGFVMVDKPPGLSSHDVVAILRAVTGIQKVGHTGTLDPFATGVLPLALGRATRLIQYLDESEKVYDATVQFGVAMDTGDPTGQPVATGPIPALEERGLLRALAGFIGDRMQTPPRYSAVKIAGRPLYDYARAGKEVEAKARPVHISAMDLLEFHPSDTAPSTQIRIHCSRGTYARVIGEELGVALGTVAHLIALRRQRSGPFSFDAAATPSLSLGQLAEIVAGTAEWTTVFRTGRRADRVPWRSREEVLAGLQPFRIQSRAVLTHLPTLTLQEADARRYRQGILPPEARALLQRVNLPLLLISAGEVIGVHVPASFAALSAQPSNGSSSS
jgi:tRNA pseudouridine(55) synthase